MFFVSDDDRKVVDSRGRIVGFVNGEKFTQHSLGRQPDEPYLAGLSPLELEHVSETIQRDKIRRNRSDVEV